MNKDEQEIRTLVARWQEATKAGDTDSVLAMMTDDVLFLAPGRLPFGKAEFASLSAPPVGSVRPTLQITQEIKELTISGDHAHMVSHLWVSITLAGAQQPMLRTGHTLTIFRKVHGAWRLARDANLLGPAPESTA